MDVNQERIDEYLAQMEAEMTDFDNEQIDDMIAAYESGDYRPDDMPPPDDAPDVECPFCGHYIEWDGLPVCHNCEVAWHSLAEIERDRQGPDDPWDALTEAQQDIHIWGGGR